MTKIRKRMYAKLPAVKVKMKAFASDIRVVVHFLFRLYKSKIFLDICNLVTER